MSTTLLFLLLMLLSPFFIVVVVVVAVVDEGGCVAVVIVLERNVLYNERRCTCRTALFIPFGIHLSMFTIFHLALVDTLPGVRVCQTIHQT